MEAVLRDPRLPEAFERVRYPQMQRELEERRTGRLRAGHHPGLDRPGFPEWERPTLFGTSTRHRTNRSAWFASTRTRLRRLV